MIFLRLEYVSLFNPLSIPDIQNPNIRFLDKIYWFLTNVEEYN